jgi:hypothetical protein
MLEQLKIKHFLLTNMSHHATGKNNIKPQSSAGVGARWIKRRLTRRVREWERPNQIARMNTDLKKLAREAFAAPMGQDKNKNPARKLARLFLFSVNPSLLRSFDSPVPSPFGLQACSLPRACQKRSVVPGHLWLVPLQPRSARGLMVT